MEQAGKWLGKGLERGNEHDVFELTPDSNFWAAATNLFGMPGPLIEKSGKDWEASGQELAREREKKEQEEAAARQSILDIINRPPPEQPTFEWPEYEMPQIPQWTPPPTQVATPPATEAKKTYQPRRTPTVLTKPGDVAAGGKGKKKLLGE